MADSVPLDVSKYLPPSFFEGLADSFMQNLSNSIGKKILAINNDSPYSLLPAAWLSDF